MQQGIRLYHGAKRDDIETILSYGLHRDRDFFMTRHQNLAKAAAPWNRGSLLEIVVPQDVFDDAIAGGLFEERPYLGRIPIDHCTEIKIYAGEGIDLLNKYIPLRDGW